IVHAHKNNYYRKMAKAAFAASEVITGDSALLKQRGLEIGAPEENNFIIQNGVDAKRFYPFYTHLKKEYGMKEEDLLIFSPRALDENYNIDIIIDALGILKRTIGNFKCIFAYAFGGEYFNMLNTKVSQLGLESNVIWLGFTEYNDMPIYYNAADIVVSIPSSDSSPKSVYEAMFCSTPVILSDIGWVYEKLDAYDFVEKVPPRCSDSLATALLDLYHRPERRHEMQDAGLVVAAKYFEYQDNMQKMERIMEATLCAMKE
nr:glycosyltransferase family 4 protein [Gammaproteobacteria bacterium]